MSLLVQDFSIGDLVEVSDEFYNDWHGLGVVKGFGTGQFSGSPTVRINMLTGARCGNTAEFLLHELNIIIKRFNLLLGK